MTDIEMEGLGELRTKFEALMRIADDIESDCAPAICEVMRRSAVAHLSSKEAVDTGELRDSVDSKSAEFVNRKGESIVEMGIQTAVPYAIFIEYGTGSKGDPAVPHTEKESWTYYNDRKGGFRTAHPTEARPFMRPALYDNAETFTAIIQQTVERVFQ